MGLENKTTITLKHPEDDNGSWEYWEEIIQWCLEQYGVPGKRFMTTATSDYMDFIFEDEKDAVIFTLRWV
jgi:hypothetical protein